MSEETQLEYQLETIAKAIELAKKEVDEKYNRLLRDLFPVGTIFMYAASRFMVLKYHDEAVDIRDIDYNHTLLDHSFSILLEASDKVGMFEDMEWLAKYRMVI